jgi:hypothetical protein
MLCLPFKYQEDMPKVGCPKPQLFKSDTVSIYSAGAGTEFIKQGVLTSSFNK